MLLTFRITISRETEREKKNGVLKKYTYKSASLLGNKEQRRGNEEEEEVGFLLYKLNLHLLYPGKSSIEYEMTKKFSIDFNPHPLSL